MTRRPLILQLVHIPPQNKPKKGVKEKENATGKENGENGESCKLFNFIIINPCVNN